MTEVLKAELVDPLSDADFDDLDRLETDIARGFAASFAIGAALAEISTRRLYRATHATFADYCARQWQMDRSRAYQHMQAAEIIAEMSKNVDTPLPLNDGQARALAPLKEKPEQMAAAMTAAYEATEGRPTAKAITAEVKARLPKPPPPPKEDPGSDADPDSGPPPAPPAPKRSPGEQKIADAADRAAQNFVQYRQHQVDEVTVQRLELWCEKWRNQ